MTHPLDLFASCPKGLEGQLLQELLSLGAEEARETVAGVSFKGPVEVAYRCCLWSRLANRILLRLTRFAVESGDDLYRGVAAVDWSEHLAPSGSLRVDCRGEVKGINNSHFGALKAKDAIVDQMRERSGQRPSVDRQNPDLRVSLVLAKGHAIVSIDLSGQSLHQRGYRKEAGAAPLKENLAAAVLYRCGWPELATAGGSLVDPMCGSATLLIEAALMATDTAPGLARERFGFHGWQGHVPAVWQRVREEALERQARGIEGYRASITGFEGDGKVVQRAQNNIQRAGMGHCIQLQVAELATLKRPELAATPGLLVTNPPYGERLGEEASLLYLYRYLGSAMREQFLGWRGAVLTGNPELGKRMGIRARRQYSYFNGALPTRLLMFEIDPEWFVRGREGAEAGAQGVSGAAPLSAGAQMVANRLRKNRRQLAKWVRREELQCYRVYDADMPEYSAAVDLYGDWVCVQEYQAPKSIDPDKATGRLRELLSAIPEALEVDPTRIVLKERKRQSGKEQYQRQDRQGAQLEVVEHGCRLLVNLTDYLDTGLFLDHRPMRRRIGQEAKGKRFLNLFCYTGAATVHAAHGGARSSVSVDLSATYLEWARKNLSLNGFSERHQLVRADCMEWIRDNRETFDLIFIDPPTFSNSKRMEGVFDVQRDQVVLIDAAMKSLAQDGVLYFSNNFRRFQLDEGVSQRYQVEEISPQTLDPDFARNPKIHRCWRLTHRAPSAQGKKAIWGQ
ncbi:bifunctional 23S rRNA (guanine(2069)-N(7))-methyltransferase RlmK/23S rRNA (guanine(2445)-N(2))-methyltransferase RlmL [Aestuariirhabdus litorea]|uniref:Ribosomal RNA large subunit methyltransferase K/L n=1 Tax=Aestuariirhabdus litorea TaxID=2528527 RepID=A0A3P3VT29_9GAMM|nr:bifunctional 23S rRNA (guanine(2069)-N(7))-methyltransferase RlmK/23S rRNA (guanine(2445)-N(2))-methyltransferase RlmL [Aestuariirhabdus litorea]RRJ84846.1 bifunctional 23S rRNA (guanine(2069)-N(7))-methyltransferase RlmK/23S rRNA (guanine(2445)-N(2))-methyltransferase RlmL [Aestuariirhabdus litorea]RWW98073.1 bifunctional 23S rRNA (guanine(2069)-N(7))-methyltransferase RlmK/23S rRNA (guanine(2445)-N(2))-methyltransferase RlmL [Endozoicomonadaceae bacterium GTF-13]